MNLVGRLISPHRSLGVDDAISLKSLRPTHTEALFEAFDDNRDYLQAFIPWVDENDSKEAAGVFISASQILNGLRQYYGYGIFTSDDELIGHASIGDIGDPARVPQIGYWVAEDVAGNGIATKAASTLTEFGLRTLGLPKILIQVDPDNSASNRVAEKLGYRNEGIERDSRPPYHSLCHWVIDTSSVQGVNFIDKTQKI